MRTPSDLVQKTEADVRRPPAVPAPPAKRLRIPARTRRRPRRSSSSRSICAIRHMPVNTYKKPFRCHFFVTIFAKQSAFRGRSHSRLINHSKTFPAIECLSPHGASSHQG
jgi:hypothetical protein